MLGVCKKKAQYPHGFIGLFLIHSRSITETKERKFLFVIIASLYREKQ